MRFPARYSYLIFRSDRDGEYGAECEQICGLSGLAATEAGALKELKVAISIWPLTCKRPVQ